MQDRRKLDTDLTCIKVTLERIETNLENQARIYDKCDKEREILFSKSGKLNERVGSLEVKQKLVSWFGSVIGITWLGAIGKWVAQHLK